MFRWPWRRRARRCVEVLTLNDEWIFTRWREVDGTYSVEAEDIAGKHWAQRGLSRAEAKRVLQRAAGLPPGRRHFRR